MCGICGCEQTASGLGGYHTHDHVHREVAEGSNTAGPPRTRMVQVEQDIMAANQRYADANRAHFTEHAIFVVNLLSSPGSGKTSLLVEAVSLLKKRFPVAVIEGDQQTSLDTARISATGVPAWQINTGKACHLDAHTIGHALEHLPAIDGGILFIENVGNLVCPAGFDLGEAHKVVILSVTEGDDKPLKYPNIFHAADLLLLNKIDLLPYVRFDMNSAVEAARQINPKIGVFAISALTGDGLGAWLEWMVAGLDHAKERRQLALLARRAELQHELDSIDLQF